MSENKNLLIYQNKIKSHLTPPRLLLRTPKGCEHPWLGNPELEHKLLQE